MKEIRRLLGEDYHLSETIGGDYFNDVPTEWHLYKKYADLDVYYSDDNKEIMSSKTHTMEDLYKFAKTHHKIDGVSVSKCILSVCLLINCILAWVNVVINSPVIRVIVIVNAIELLAFYCFLSYCWGQNMDVKFLEIKEGFEKEMKQIAEEIEKKHQKPAKRGKKDEKPRRN